MHIINLERLLALRLGETAVVRLFTRHLSFLFFSTSLLADDAEVRVLEVLESSEGEIENYLRNEAKLSAIEQQQEEYR